MAYKGLVFKNQATPDKPFIIEIEGVIGYEKWDNPAETVETKEQMLAELKTIGETQRDKVIVRIIGCWGGDVNHALSIHDLLKTNFKEVETEAHGTIASAAVIVFAAGTTRRQSDNSLMLIHRAMTWAGGNINDFKQATEDLVKYDDRIINIFVKATGKPITEITALMDENNGNGKWLSPKEAKTSGLTTEIFEPTFKVAAKATKAILNRYGYPELPEGIITNTEDPLLETTQLKKIFSTVKKMIDKATTPPQPPELPNTKNDMIKQFLNLNKALGVENLESADEKKGVYLNEAQLEKISNTIQTAEDATAAAISAAATEKTAHDSALQAVTAEKATAEAAQKTAEASLTTAISEVDEVDATVKAAVDFPAKLAAVKAFVAKKPGITPPGTQGDKDLGTTPADGVDHKTLNELPHQKAARAMFGD